MSTLYLVATPIGNLEDISARALRILREVRLVAAEDTRQTQKLFEHFQIHTPLTSYHEHNKIGKIEPLLNALQAGDAALVSDAGTPALNDPGYELVRAAIAAGHRICPIPGPASPIAALISSGLPTDTFLYLGFLPRKSNERVALLREVKSLRHTLIFLETPHRLLAALDDLHSELGDRPAAAARELTKIHEEIARGTLSELRQKFTETEPRGEFTLVVGGCPVETETWDETRLADAIQTGMNAGIPPSELAQTLAAQSGWQRREIYRRILKG